MIAPGVSGLALLVTIWLILWTIAGWKQGTTWRTPLAFGVAAAVAAVSCGGYDGLGMAAIALAQVWIAATKYIRSQNPVDRDVESEARQ